MRDCGECQVCCWLYCIPELDKPPRTNCKHQCASGCAIHEQPRPPICTDFVCCWKKLDWPEELRPDKCHVVFSDCHCGKNGRRIFVAVQANPYARLRRDVKGWAEQLARRGHLFLFTYEGEEGPEYAGLFNERLYPGCSAQALLDIVTSLDSGGIQQVRDWHARHGGDAPDAG